MVKDEKQHSEKARAKQGSPADSPESHQITASTPFDFGVKNLLRLVFRGDHVGEVRLQETGGKNPDVGWPS